MERDVFAAKGDTMVHDSQVGCDQRHETAKRHPEHQAQVDPMLQTAACWIVVQHLHTWTLHRYRGGCAPEQMSGEAMDPEDPERRNDPRT
jgi:hypothetical protein